MTAINANMNGSVDWIPLSEADATSLEPGLYTIGSENLEVGGPHRATPSRFETPFNGRWVKRGQFGSTAASHTSGATLTRYYPDAPASGGAGGVTVDNQVDPPAQVSTIVAPGATVAGDEADLSGLLMASLIGPFPVTFETPGILDVGAILTTLEPGQIVLSAWAEGVTIFAGGGVTAAVMEVWVGTQSEFSGDVAYAAPVQGLANNSDSQIGAGLSAAVSIVNDPLNFVRSRVIRCKTAAELYVWVNATGGTPTQGASDIYALIATSAA